MLHIDLDNELGPDDRTGTGRRSALEAALRSSIRDGRLAAGATVPSTRELAGDLGLSRSTVVAAYEQLVAEGYLHAVHGSATTVASLPANTSIADEADEVHELDEFRMRPTHDFRPGEPAAGSFPRSRWLRSVRRVLSESPDSGLTYPDLRGVAELRTTVAARLARTRTVHADRAAVHIVGGYGSGLGFVAETLRSRGVDRVAVEDPTLPFYTHVLRSVGLRTVPVPVDADGIDIDQLRAAEVGAVVVSPAHQYPTGVTMSAERRTALVDWARHGGAWIIEDDYDGEFRYDRRPIGSLQGLCPDRVVYAGTVSKSLTPALRLAWLVVPAELRTDLLRVIGVRAGVSAIDQLALADFIERGELDRHVRSMRTIYRGRSLALRAVLTETAQWLEPSEGAAGLHLMASLRSARLDEATVIEAAEAASVGLAGLITHHRSTSAGPGFAIGFSRPPEHHFPTALERLGELFSGLG